MPIQEDVSTANSGMNSNATHTPEIEVHPPSQSETVSGEPAQVSTVEKKNTSRTRKKTSAKSSLDSPEVTTLDTLIPAAPSKPRRKSSTSTSEEDGKVKSARKSSRKSSPKSASRKSSRKVSNTSSSPKRMSETPSGISPSLANEDSTSPVSSIPRESVSLDVDSKPATLVGLSAKSSSSKTKEVNHKVLKEVHAMTEQIKKSFAVEESGNPTEVQKEEAVAIPNHDSTQVKEEVATQPAHPSEAKESAKTDPEVSKKSGTSTRDKREKKKTKKSPLPQSATQEKKNDGSTQVQGEEKGKGEKKIHPAPVQNQKQNRNQAKRRNRSRRPVPVPPKMSKARFSDKVFQNASEALSRVLVRKEQKALVKFNLQGEVLDADVPLNSTQPNNVQVTHGKDAMTPPQTMKMPKVPPETRPGRAAMFGNVPMNPIHYEPRHKAEDYSRAYLREKVFIDSDSAQRLFESSYDDVNVSFSVLTSVLRRFDKSTFNKTEKQIIAELTKIQQHFIYAIDEISKTIEQCVPEENRRVAYHDHEREYEVPIHTPYSLRFITCVALYDRYISRLNAALITGLIDYDNLDTCTRTASEILKGFVRNTVMLRYRSIRDLTAKSGRKTEIKRATQMAEKAAQEDKITTSDPHPVAKRENAKSENRK